MTKEEIERIIAVVLQDVCDLPDRTSPDDQPEMMLVTGDELAGILESALIAATERAAISSGERTK